MPEGPFIINTRLKCDGERIAGKLTPLAEACLSVRPVSVMDKAKVPPSGDKHDWMNLADYSWPDPDSPDGLPYISRDGEANPEAALYDRRRFNRLVISVLRLGSAWQATGERAYAIKAIEMIGHWFIEPGTAMNPNLNFAHHVPGDTPGRMDGLIVFCSALPSLMDSWLAFRQAGLVGPAAHHSLVVWAEAFLGWLLTDPMSIEHENAVNNHGTYHDFLITYLMLFLDRPGEAAEGIERSLKTRLPAQVKADGEQPMETGRTLSSQYSLYNLKALMSLARLGESVGIDGWQGQAAHPPIRMATDFLYRAATGDRPWPYQQIEPPNWAFLTPLCTVANRIYGDVFDITRLPADAPAGTIPVEPVASLPGWELLFVPSHQQHLAISEDGPAPS